MKPPAGVSHISFDLWLTLIRSHPGFKPMRDELLRNHFSIAAPVEKVSQAVRHYDRLFDHISHRTGRTIDTFSLLLVILDSLGTDIANVTVAQLEAFYEEMEALFFAYPPLLIDARTTEVLQTLQQQGTPLSILSNTAFIRGKTLRQLLGRLGIGECFSFQLYSDELGWSKPAPEAFQKLWEEACSRRSLRKENILHIGDNPLADGEGAARFGIRNLVIEGTSTAIGRLTELCN
jgi:putative hydrolase of the HAD superfamily